MKTRDLHANYIGLLSRSLSFNGERRSTEAVENKAADARAEIGARRFEYRTGAGSVLVTSICGPVAQGIEHPPSKRGVAGSNPAGATISPFILRPEVRP